MKTSYKKVGSSGASPGQFNNLSQRSFSIRIKPIKINESGLYSLILRSKLQVGGQAQKIHEIISQSQPPFTSLIHETSPDFSVHVT